MSSKEAFAWLGDWILQSDNDLRQMVDKACQENPWFAFKHVEQALNAIASQYLDSTKLESWRSKYPNTGTNGKQIALVLAGNVPLVGFHDVLCVLMSGHQAMVKLSERDSILLPGLIQKMESRFPPIRGKVQFVTRLKAYDAVIATGSNQASTYFRKYFSHCPNIIRKNRNGVAVLSGHESTADILNLGHDIFSHFGLGCRNVSKIYVPKNYDFRPLLEGLNSFRDLSNHSKYKNNYDYNLASAVINGKQYMSNDCVILIEDEVIPSRIAVLHYEFYDDLKVLEENLISQMDQIQCIITQMSKLNVKTLEFGRAQCPALTDYADGVDTMKFLLTV